MTEKLLELRKLKKSRKPAFVAQDSQRRKEIVQGSWRRPKGMHSKMRLNKRGNPKTPSHGYRSPKAVRYLHPSGLKPVIVSSLKQLESLKDEGVVIASSVGMKKSLEIIKAGSVKKLAILNIDAQNVIKKAEAELAERKKRKTAAISKAAKTAKPKKEEQARKEKKPESEEEKRKEAKKEMEKIITKRG